MPSSQSKNPEEKPKAVRVYEVRTENLLDGIPISLRGFNIEGVLYQGGFHYRGFYEYDGKLSALGRIFANFPLGSPEFKTKLRRYLDNGRWFEWDTDRVEIIQLGSWIVFISRKGELKKLRQAIKKAVKENTTLLILDLKSTTEKLLAAGYSTDDVHDMIDHHVIESVQES